MLHPPSTLTLPFLGGRDPPPRSLFSQGTRGRSKKHHPTKTSRFPLSLYKGGPLSVLLGTGTNNWNRRRVFNPLQIPPPLVVFLPLQGFFGGVGGLDWPSSPILLLFSLYPDWSSAPSIPPLPFLVSRIPSRISVGGEGERHKNPTTIKRQREKGGE